MTRPWTPDESGLHPVFAAVIKRSDCLLIAKRPINKRHGGLWEFPGGKLEPGESLEDAARRELMEELGASVDSVGPILFRKHDPGSSYEILFVATTIIGEPSAIEHDELRWVTAAQAASLDLAPSDKVFVLTLVDSDKATDSPDQHQIAK